MSVLRPYGALTVTLFPRTGRAGGTFVPSARPVVVAGASSGCGPGTDQVSAIENGSVTDQIEIGVNGPM